MRQAALAAGLWTEATPQQLLFALEPEAAAFACHADMKDQGQMLPGGTKYFLLDCGGSL